MDGFAILIGLALLWFFWHDSQNDPEYDDKCGYFGNE